MLTDIRHKAVVLLACVPLALAAACGGMSEVATPTQIQTPTRPSINNDTCDRFAKDIQILYSLHDQQDRRKSNDTFRPVSKSESDIPITVRLTPSKEIKHTDKELWCEGIVKWDNGEKEELIFKRYVDEDGDEFYYWKRKHSGY